MRCHQYIVLSVTDLIQYCNHAGQYVLFVEMFITQTADQIDTEEHIFQVYNGLP